MDLVLAKIDENGVVSNPNDLNILDASTAFSNVFISIHGWWTGAEQAASEYATFVSGLSSRFAALRANLPIPPDAQLLPIGIVWPSMVPASLGPFRTIFEAFSYDDMRSRAELIAKTAVATLIRRVWSLAGTGRQLRIHILAHSMGCRVACQALETALLADSEPKDPADPATAPWSEFCRT